MDKFSKVYRPNCERTRELATIWATTALVRSISFKFKLFPSLSPSSLIMHKWYLRKIITKKVCAKLWAKVQVRANLEQLQHDLQNLANGLYSVDATFRQQRKLHYVCKCLVSEYHHDVNSLTNITNVFRTMQLIHVPTQTKRLGTQRGLAALQLEATNKFTRRTLEFRTNRRNVRLNTKH